MEVVSAPAIVAVIVGLALVAPMVACWAFEAVQRRFEECRVRRRSSQIEAARVAEVCRVGHQAMSLSKDLESDRQAASLALTRAMVLFLTGAADLEDLRRP